MGQFSWLDCKNKRRAIKSGKEVNTYVLIPKEFGGGHIVETCYDGYGHFDGHDIYELVVDWNLNYLLPEEFNDFKGLRGNKYSQEQLVKFLQRDKINCEKRHLGICIACYDEDNAKLKYPIKITHDKDAIYENCKISLGDPNQGW